MGPYYTTAYIAKAIEVALIVLVAIDFARHDGNPVSRRPPRARLVRLARLRRRGTAAAGA